MTTRGVGSFNSPIIVSDDDENDVKELELNLEVHRASPDTYSDSSEPYPCSKREDLLPSSKAYKMILGMGYVPGHGLGVELDGEVEPLPYVWKRKPGVGGIGSNVASSSRNSQPLRREQSSPRSLKRKRDNGAAERTSSVTQRGYQGPEARLSKNKKKKLDRQSRFDTQSFLPMRPSRPPVPPLDLRKVPENSGSDMRHSLSPVASSSAHSGRHVSTSPSLLLNIPHLPLKPTFSSIPPPITPSSSMLSVPMALAAAASSTNSSSLTEPSVDPPPPPPPPTTHLKKSSLPIGMTPNPDPHNKRGIYTFAPEDASVTPDPSRTLIMENIPRSLRNFEWVEKWCRVASGVLPSFVHIGSEGMAGKAFIEFQSSLRAKMAFDSPRLSDKGGKGGIRVWWYRNPLMPDEIEEGEIPDGILEKSLQVAAKSRKPKKNKKKEMKKPDLSPTTARPLVSNGLFSSPTDVGPRLTSALPMLPNHPLFQVPGYAPFFDAHLGIPGYSLSFSGSSNSYPSPAPSLLLDDQYSAHDETGFVHSEGPSRLWTRAQGDYIDNDSIASSRAASPTLNTSQTSAATPQRKSLDADDGAEDMDVESPINPRSQIRIMDAYYAQSGDRVSRPVDQKANGIAAPQPTVAAPVHPFSLLPTPPLPPDASLSMDRNISTSTCTPILTSTISPDTLSNPRAPKTPSHTKQSLLARQKELEERIARSRQELDMAVKTKVTVTTASTPSSSSSGLATPHDTRTEPGADKLVMEEKLRGLVLKSKKATVVSEPRIPHTPQSQTSATILAPSPLVNMQVSSGSSTTSSRDDTPSYVSEDSSQLDAFLLSSSSSTSSTSHKTILSSSDTQSFDDLAISFITETIQTIKVPPLKPTPTFSLQKLELAAKQRMLEQHINESKALMTKLTLATTKQEKDRILTLMRESSRRMEEIMKMASAPVTNNEFSAIDQQDTRVVLHQKIRWPETRHDAGILIISDDEDE